MNQGQYDTIETMLSDEYTRGYAEGTRHGMEISKDYDEGLNDAWELARKLIYSSGDYEGAYSIKEMNFIFGKRGYLSIMKSFTAKEALTKIKEYEEKQKEAAEIKIGDEVTDNDGWEGVVTWISPDPDGEYLIILQKDGTALHWKKNIFKKTGRHFSEIAEVLKQMQEGNE